MIPITLNTFNRLALLERMVASLNATEWPNGDYHLFVHDDGSKQGVFDILDTIDVPFPVKVRREWRTGMIWNNLHSMCYAMDRADEYVVKIESDALLHPKWLHAITDLYRRMKMACVPRDIAQVSGFYWERLRVLDEGPGWRRLNASGAVCCIIDKEFWTKHRIGERAAIDYGRCKAAKQPHVSWPAAMAHACKHEGGWIIATTPSYAQHLGVDPDASSSPTAPLAVAPDFVGDMP